MVRQVNQDLDFNIDQESHYMILTLPHLSKRILHSTRASRNQLESSMDGIEHNTATDASFIGIAPKHKALAEGAAEEGFS